MDKKFLTPVEAAEAVMSNGKRVLTQSFASTVVLSLLAGFYIAFGAQLATVVTHDAAAYLGSGVARFLGGSVFSVGLMLVVICGAELFTGNTLLAKTALHGAIPWSKLLENWTVVILGNFVASLLFAWLMAHSGLLTGVIADHAINIALRKCSLPFGEALIRGILCNWLVCLAILMAAAACDIGGKILACYVPIMAFVTSGFEHSVANMYFIPAGLFASAAGTGPAPSGLNWSAFLLGNLLPVTIGNIIGGCLFVAGAYWFIHLRGSRS